jgi:methylenetetrahydrofolate reductase (NADPH)
MTTTTPAPALPLSLEFFPPKTPEGADKLTAVRQQLYALKPQFCSVTYGAGGSTQDGTLSTVQAIQREGVEAASHFTCIGASRDSIREKLKQFQADGIRRIVALRGDLPSGYGGFGEFRYASDLVAFINSDAYFRFVDDAQALGADIPVVPGIMPITNASGIIRFADGCGAEIPRWMRLRLQGFGDDTASIKAFGLDVITDLCEQLRSVGVPGLHFYTMNQSAAVLEIARRLEL